MSGRVPVVHQLAANDCGAACLTMVLALHGRHVRLEELSATLGSDRDGATPKALVRAASAHGLAAHVVRADDVKALSRGALLHWEFRHWVVLERADDDGGASVVDPARGRRRVSAAELSRAFTGVAIVMSPGATFRRQRRAPTDRRWLWGQLAAHTPSLARIAVTSVLLALVALALPLLTGALVDRIAPARDRGLLAVLTWCALPVLLMHVVTGLVRAQLLLHLRTQLDARLTNAFLSHLFSLPYAFFQRRSAGDLVTRMNSNAQIRELLASGALSALLDGLFVTLYLAVLLVLDVRMGLLAAALGAAQIAVLALGHRRHEDLAATVLAQQARATGYQVEMLRSMETLKTMGREDRAAAHWTALHTDVLQATLAQGRWQALVDTLLASFRLGAPLALLLVGGRQVVAGELGLGTMLALMSVATGFLGPLGSLVGVATSLPLLSSYAARIDDVLRTPPEQPTPLPPAPELSGAVRLHGVSFAYGVDAPAVLKDVNLDIMPGTFVGIVGKSGVGKSTLARLLTGLYLPTAGRVTFGAAGENIGDVELDAVDLRSLRRQLGIVPQTPSLFGATIKSNIALADARMPLARVERAARLACIHDDITKMPMKYETLVADGGAALSGGQRQRLALARALAHEPALLVLDEATSALDAVTEAACAAALASLRCTRVVIAHRLSTIVNADIILVLDDGHIVERGTHAELVARGGAYARLVSAQLEARTDAQRHAAAAVAA